MATMSGDEARALGATHAGEKHPVERIEELGTVTVYYGRGSFETYAYDWCPQCREIYRVTLSHGHGIRKPRDVWQQQVRESREANEAMLPKALAYRAQRRGEAVNR